jgi:hypothetical protein
MNDITLELASGSIPARAYPTMRLHRVGDTIDIYINGARVAVLDLDEWRWLVEAMERKE